MQIYSISRGVKNEAGDRVSANLTGDSNESVPYLGSTQWSPLLRVNSR